MDFLDLVASCDIYDRLDGLIHQATGDWIRLEWERQENGPRGGDIERELKRLGVPICGRWFSPPSEEHEFGALSCLVRKSQVRWAEYVLTAYGLAFTSEPIDAKSAAAAMRRQDRPIPAWSEQRPQMITRAIRLQAKETEKPLLGRLKDWLVNG